MTADSSKLVWNHVWAGTAFAYLRYFAASQLASTDGRFRFVANGCPPDELARMEAFAELYPDRITEILVVSDVEIMTHGAALDETRRRTDDGARFCLIDTDILATGPFADDFLALFEDGVVATSSGRGVWAETDVIPEGHVGVNGEYFFSADGFVFGSPHFAVYDRAAVEATSQRWQVGFGSGGPQLPDATKAALAALDREYWVYDTGKALNALLQHDGGVFVHREHDNLMHIGGMSHYLAPPETSGTAAGRAANPDWAATWDPNRLEVAQYCAAVLTECAAGRPAPPLPAAEPGRIERLARVRAAIIDMVDRYRADVAE